MPSNLGFGDRFKPKKIQAKSLEELSVKCFERSRFLLRQEISFMKEFMLSLEVPCDDCSGTGGIDKAKNCKYCKGTGCVTAWKLYNQ